MMAVWRGFPIFDFAKEHDLKIASIADLIAWRRRNESLVQRMVETTVNTQIGYWHDDLCEYYFNIEHIALVKGIGGISGLRAHALDLMADLLGGIGKAGGNLAAMQMLPMPVGDCGCSA